MAPEGWKDQPLSDIATIVGGGTPSRSQPAYWDGDVPWTTPTDVTRLPGRTISETASTITDAGLASSSSTLLPPNSLLMTTRATIGACAINVVSMATNQGFQNLVAEAELVCRLSLLSDSPSQTETGATGGGKYVSGSVETSNPCLSSTSPATTRAAQDCRHPLLGGRRHREDPSGYRPSAGCQARPDAGVAHARLTGSTHAI